MIEQVANEVRERLTAIHALGLLGDRRAVADLSDKLIEDLRRRSVDQLVHVVAELARHDPFVLAHVVVATASHEAVANAEAMVLSVQGDHPNA